MRHEQEARPRTEDQHDPEQHCQPVMADAQPEHAGVAAHDEAVRLDHRMGPRLEEIGSEHRRHEARGEQREEDLDRDRDAELLEKLSGDAAHEADGDENGDDGQADGNAEELRKFGGGRYKGSEIDLKHLAKVLPETVDRFRWDADWPDYTAEMKARFYGTETSSTARRLNTLSPYAVIRRLNEIVADDAIVAADTGAAVCWLHQAFAVKRHNLFTSGGNSPMGYALCAALAAKLEAPEKQVICYTGDGGLQVNSCRPSSSSGSTSRSWSRTTAATASSSSSRTAISAAATPRPTCSTSAPARP